jgi:hypothetical protein
MFSSFDGDDNQWHYSSGLAQAAVNTVPEPKSVRMRSRWLALSPNTIIQIIPQSV